MIGVLGGFCTRCLGFVVGLLFDLPVVGCVVFLILLFALLICLGFC